MVLKKKTGKEHFHHFGIRENRRGVIIPPAVQSGNAAAIGNAQLDGGYLGDTAGMCYKP